MAEKLIRLEFGDGDVVSATLGASIDRGELYGKQSKTVEKDGVVLEKVVLDPEGHVFLPSDVANLPTDGQGSLTTPPLVRTEDGEILPERPSSFKEKRPLREAAIGDLVRLRVESVFPVRCDLPPGLYCTEFTYFDSPVPKDAVLNVTAAGAFLLTGTFVDAPLQRNTDVYSFFDDDDDELEDDGGGDNDGISFTMF